MQLLWAILGWSALLLAAIGTVLPIMPTVPFVLLAAFAFARSSERVHDWLLSHPVFGAAITDWRERGAISRKGKLFATGSFIASAGLGVALGLPGWAVMIQIAAMAAVAAFMWSRPNA